MRRSIRYFSLTSLLVVFFFPRAADATALFYIVTPTGIVLGMDGKITITKNGCSNTLLKVGTLRKIVLLKHRFAFGAVGMDKAIGPDKRTVLYDLPTWTRAVDHELNRNAPVNELVGIIEERSPDALSWINGHIGSYACPGYKYLVQYVVAGYAASVPVVYEIGIQLDWEHNAIRTPEQIQLNPCQSQKVDDATGGLGIAYAVNDMCNAQTDAYKKAVAKFPDQRVAYCSRNYSNISLDEASDLVRVLLSVQSETNSDMVGRPFTIVTIPKSGKGRVKRYNKPFVSNATRLLERSDSEQKQAHNYKGYVPKN
jgi:hypothetical protein